MLSHSTIHITIYCLL